MNKTCKQHQTPFLSQVDIVMEILETSPQCHQRRQVFDSAPCTHNVPGVPTPVVCSMHGWRRIVLKVDVAGAPSASAPL